MPNGQVTLSKKIEAVDEKAQLILDILIGNPKDPDKPGLVQRVKALEDERKTAKENSTWLARAMASPAISAIVTGTVIFVGEALLYYWQVKPLLDSIKVDELMKK